MGITVKKVSICIPTYNSERFITETLNSIVEQTYSNLEVIISDNASTDKTIEIATDYCNRYGWKLYQNIVNIGAGNNFNKLIGLATGEYIAIYHADDVYNPMIVEESVQVFDQNSDIGLIGTEANIINEEGIIIGEFTRPIQFKKINKVIMSFDEVFEGIIRDVMLVTPSIMVKKEMYERYGRFLVDSKYGAACDYELWLRFAYQKKVAILDKKLISYRIHNSQGSELELRRNVKIPDIVAVYQEYMTKLTNQVVYQKAHVHAQKLIFASAIKQNIFGMYLESNQTLNKVNASNYYIPKAFLYAFNYFRFPMHLIPFFGKKLKIKLSL